VIKSSGYRIGPFEVESALVEHPAVLEAGVVGKPDPLRGQIVKAWVVLRPEVASTEELKGELQAHCKRLVAAYKYPREIEFVSELPKTTSGKTRHFELRQASMRGPGAASQVAAP
jgi:acyl-coenzyme A synthetase/AMP-(fatty) acid ligase